MPAPRRIAPFATLIVFLACVVSARGPQAPDTAPADLRPLLAAPRSELRMVAQRYALDRATLSGNYANGAARGGGGRRGRAGNADQASVPSLIPVSTARIARLKRFDANWQAALERVDSSRLTAQARSDLTELSGTIAANTAQLEEDGDLRQCVGCGAGLHAAEYRARSRGVPCGRWRPDHQVGSPSFGLERPSGGCVRWALRRTRGAVQPSRAGDARCWRSPTRPHRCRAVRPAWTWRRG